MNLAIIIAAAGSGHRFGADKLSEGFGGKTVLETAVERLHDALPTAPIIVVVAPRHAERWRAVLAVDRIVIGGDRRQESVRNGVEAAVALGVYGLLNYFG